MFFRFRKFRIVLLIPLFCLQSIESQRQLSCTATQPKINSGKAMTIRNKTKCFDRKQLPLYGKWIVYLNNTTGKFAEQKGPKTKSSNKKSRPAKWIERQTHRKGQKTTLEKISRLNSSQCGASIYLLETLVTSECRVSINGLKYWKTKCTNRWMSFSFQTAREWATLFLPFIRYVCSYVEQAVTVGRKSTNLNNALLILLNVCAAGQTQFIRNVCKKREENRNTFCMSIYT